MFISSRITIYMKKDFSEVFESLTPGQRRMSRALIFLARLNVLAVPLYLIILIGADLWVLQLGVATHSSWVLQALGYQVVQDGASVTVNQAFRFFIVQDCTAWKGMLFLFALLFAVPGIALKKRALGLALGLPVIWLVNLARIAGIVVAQSFWGTRTAMLIHDWLFQAVLIFTVLGIWAVWLAWSGRLKKINFLSPFS